MKPIIKPITGTKLLLLMIVWLITAAITTYALKHYLIKDLHTEKNTK